MSLRSSLARRLARFMRAKPSPKRKARLPGTSRPSLEQLESRQLMATAPFGEGQTFALHSNPDATHVIYLDFNGHTTTGTGWNRLDVNGNPIDLPTIESPAFDIDGDADTFNADEHERIQRIWQRVAEDFAPFDVDVTTEDPGGAGLVKSNADDVHCGVRAVIGGTGNWYGKTNSGWANYDFCDAEGAPAFIWSASESINGDEQETAQTISHEVGHTLGLNHDGADLDRDGVREIDYYRGQGTGATAWAPIMGYNLTDNDLTQWDRGEFRGATNGQDDLSIITTRNGFGYRADDHANAGNSASLLDVMGGTVRGQGLIEQNTDEDWFTFEAAPGPLHLQIDVAERGPNLDVVAHLFDEFGRLLTANGRGDDALDATIDLDVAGGVYFLKIAGTGRGDPMVDGYSNYGSLGQYFVRGTVTPVPVASTATGDFNNDGYADLATGLPYEQVNGQSRAGAVRISYGSATGLRNARIETWHQDTIDVLGTVEAGDWFGWSVATGDFNADGYADLAVGIPGEDVGTTVDAGAVQILYGSRTGITATGDALWDQNSTGIGDSAETGDQFGAALAVGDFNGDGRRDLAIGVPGEGDLARADFGLVQVLYGAASGISATNSQDWGQHVEGVLGNREAGDRFGSALAAGDFDGDRRSDLVVGVPGESINGLQDAGAVNVFYGTAAGLSATNNQFFHQDTPDVEAQVEAGDWFGFALTTGDFDADGRHDLAIGVPGEDVGAVRDAGTVNVLYGSSARLSANRDQVWDQNVTGIDGDSEADDRLGWALATGRFDTDASDDLAIGVPGEDIGTVRDAGMVNVLYGAARTGLSSTKNQGWHQDSTNVVGQSETRDRFGAAVAAGDFNRDGVADLVIAVAGEDDEAARRNDVALMQVLYGSRPRNRLAADNNDAYFL